MGKPKPFVQIACVCENVIVEKDNVVSAIRLVDLFNVNIPKDLPANIPQVFPLTILVGVKSGDVKGSGNLSVTGWRPDGTQGGTLDNTVELLGAGHGMTIKMLFNVLNPQHGLYWFDVKWDGELLTRIPADIRITHTPPQIQVEAQKQP